MRAFVNALLVSVCIAYVSACPEKCSCQGTLVDCSDLGFNSVPQGIPKNVQKLHLQRNNISVIRRSDFEGLTEVKQLQLRDNNIMRIEQGALDDLRSLQKMLLNRNQLSVLPDSLFRNTEKLVRLDLSDNRLKSISKKSLDGLSGLHHLQLHNNEINCLSADALKDMSNMKILTLNRNNITTLASDIFANMGELRVLRLAENNLVCDCHLSWLSKWMKMHRTLALFTRCHSPANLRNVAVAELHEKSFECTYDQSHRPPSQCEKTATCPSQCKCTKEIVDCRNKGLLEIPANIPETTKELRLEHNKITVIPANAFLHVKKLQRMDLSNNNIRELHSDSFVGLKSLLSLVVYENRISSLPRGIFRDLSSLQLLLLNANKISCIRKDTFEGLQNLNLLSLYDNKIPSIANGTFSPLKSIQTMHLAGNPFICDCNLRWLSEFLHAHPIETSGARCVMPKRMQRKKIGYFASVKFQCGEEYRTMNAHMCDAISMCPSQCTCQDNRVDCSGKGLTEIPENLPKLTTELYLRDNSISVIKKDSSLRTLEFLRKLDFRNNKIEKIEEGAFLGNNHLDYLQLTENGLTYLRRGMFQGLRRLQTLMLRSNKLTCINNSTFLEMPSLRLISLYDNQVTCVAKGAFDRQSHLATLNLLANPFLCNCNLGWLVDWLRTRKIVTGHLRCDGPSTVHNIPLMDLPSTDFVCEEWNDVGCNRGHPQCCPDPEVASESMNSCEQRAYCPPKCKCQGTVIRCSGARLNQIPRDIPLDTTELYLDNNNIKEIDGQLDRLTKLTKVDLSRNKLAALPDNAFVKNTLLSSLILAFNQLQCIQSKSFAGLSNLRVLSLHANNISTIPYGSFEDMTSLTHLALGTNSLYCDCKIKWLADWIKKDYREPGIAICTGPKSMVNTLLLNTVPDSFLCDENPDPAILAKCDICYTHPCQNGATCHLRKFNDYECECPIGFHGQRCENMIDACFGQPCTNGGTCTVVDQYGRFSCLCPAGFEGDRCETNINDCLGHKCLNGAECVDLIDEYSCSCPKGFMGNYCEKEINFCSEFNPCHDGSTCVPLIKDYRCICQPGFDNKNCSNNINDCVGHICQNGATCIDQVNGYRCQCPDGVTGTYCEIRTLKSVQYPLTSACVNHECKNGGACFQLPRSNDYECRCPAGFDGKNCEKLTSIHFERGSYAEIPALPFAPSVNMTVVLTTRGKSGIILYHGLDQHIAVELFLGHVRVSFDIGNYPVSQLYSFEKINDGLPHVLEMLILNKNFTMRIDHGRPRTILNDGEKTKMVVSEPTYLGGLPRHVGQRAVVKYQVKKGDSFTGCMSKVMINNKMVDFMASSVRRHKVMPGCPESQHDKEPPRRHDNPCRPNPCKTGRCKVKNKGYICKCRKGYSGKNCDVEPTCNGVVHRDVYTDPKTGCKSKSKVRHRLCQGSCGGGTCCRPHRFKERKIKVFCDHDNTSYVTDIKVVRRCKCMSCRTDN